MGKATSHPDSEIPNVGIWTPFNQILRVHDVRREIVVYENVPGFQRRDVANRNDKNNRGNDESA